MKIVALAIVSALWKLYCVLCESHLKSQTGKLLKAKKAKCITEYFIQDAVITRIQKSINKKYKYKKESITRYSSFAL